MKKALVIGGSNGIGLGVCAALCRRGFEVTIIDKEAPRQELLPAPCAYEACDLRFLSEEQFAPWAEDPALELVFISAGFGRVADFEDHHPAEIRAMMEVNASAPLRLLRVFYPRLLGQERFYCGIMGSIAGLLSSPMAAVYAASKAAVCRFAESVNVELEEKGSPNRILNVSPGSFRGSRFYGGENEPALLEGLAEQITESLFAGQTLLIPDYEKTYRSVLERYQADPHGFGLSSYAYKQASGRAQPGKKLVIGYLSGTFDLFHVGHLNLLRRARVQCDYLIVGVHRSGAWKGKETFISFEDRMAVVGGCRWVDKVVPSCAEDSDAWALWHFDRLFVGSDYQGSERFRRYEAYFRDKGVEIVYFPYTQSTSSTMIRNQIRNSQQKE